MRFDVVIFCGLVLVLCLVCPLLSVSEDCPFLIAPSVFSNVYLKINLERICGCCRQFSHVIIMIGCCLAPSKHFVSNIIARTSYFWWDDDYICFIVDKQRKTTIYTPYVRQVTNFFRLLSVSVQGYSRNASCTLNLISTFLFGYIILTPSQQAFVLLLSVVCLSGRQKIQNV
jgi:hypothetical protein